MTLPSIRRTPQRIHEQEIQLSVEARPVDGEEIVVHWIPRSDAVGASPTKQNCE